MWTYLQPLQLLLKLTAVLLVALTQLFLFLGLGCLLLSLRLQLAVGKHNRGEHMQVKEDESCFSKCTATTLLIGSTTVCFLEKGDEVSGDSEVGGDARVSYQPQGDYATSFLDLSALRTSRRSASTF